MRKLSLAALILTGCAGTAQYSGPESVEFDAAGDRYLVSCTGNSTIKQRAQDGTVTDFVSTLPAAPYGLEIKGDTLFANVGGSVMGFLLSTAEQVFNLNVGGSFLNGLATDGHFLYTSDFSTKKIFKVDPDAGTFTTLVANTTQTPNGLVYDPTLGRLWLACWGSSARIKGYDPISGAEVSTYTTTLANIDGITLDCQGRLLVASWSPNQITRFENTFTQPAAVVLGTGLNHPADIDYDEVNHRVCIPNAGSNTVVLADDASCIMNVLEQPGYRTINAVPNPTDGLVSIDMDMEEPQPFMVFNQRGLLVASGTLRPRAMLDVRSLATGVYMIDLPRIKRFVRVVKN
jgi:DNA-binding beta-propeller fold protein YncE